MYRYTYTKVCARFARASGPGPWNWNVAFQHFEIENCQENIKKNKPNVILVYLWRNLWLSWAFLKDGSCQSLSRQRAPFTRYKEPQPILASFSIGNFRAPSRKSNAGWRHTSLCPGHLLLRNSSPLAFPRNCETLLKVDRQRASYPDSTLCSRKRKMRRTSKQQRSWVKSAGTSRLREPYFDALLQSCHL